MANKGETRQQKTLSAEKIMGYERKKSIWRVSYKCGAHNKKQGLPLEFVIRDLLGYAKTMKEVKKVLQTEEIKINGLVRKEIKFTAGLFDIIDVIPKKERYVILFDKKGRAKLKQIPITEQLTKLSKVLDKKVIAKGKIQLRTNDGRTIILDKTEIKNGDTVQLILPTQEIKKKIEFKENNLVYIMGGKHIGETAIVQKISPGTVKGPALVDLKSEEKEFQTLSSYVFIIGEKKSEIEL